MEHITAWFFTEIFKRRANIQYWLYFILDTLALQSNFGCNRSMFIQFNKEELFLNLFLLCKQGEKIDARRLMKYYGEKTKVR